MKFTYQGRKADNKQINKQIYDMSECDKNYGKM